MEIVKAFENNSMNIKIDILGSKEEPLFRANDIGLILEMNCIRSSIRDFDESEKVVLKVHTLGGSQDVSFLTEKGLYQILFLSRKPIAKQFKNWVYEILKELRLNGKYEMEKQLLTNIQNKEKSLVDNFDKKPVVYLCLAEKNVVKFGLSNNIRQRLNDHKKEIGILTTLEYVIETIYNREVEQLIKNTLSHRRIDKVYNGKNQTELIQLDELYTIEKLYEDVCKLKTSINNDLVLKLINENSELKLKVELLELSIKNFENTIKEKDQEIENLKNHTQTVIIKKDKEIIKALGQDHKKIIVRDIDTGLETVYKSVEEASRHLNVSPHSLRDNYMNKPLQLKGFHIREEGTPYWKKPDNFNYIRTAKSSTHMIPIKATNIKTGVVSYYNSITEATNLLNLYELTNKDRPDDKKVSRQTVERTLNYNSSGLVKTQSKDPIISAYKWEKLESCGSFVSPDGTVVDVEKKLISS